MPTQQPRTYAAAHFALELDQKDEVGLFKSIEGGSIKTDVMTYQNGTGFDRWRQLGKPKFEDLKLQVGMSMSRPFYTWISDFLEKKIVRKTGAIVAADFYYKERARREFSEALIKEIVFPKLDGTDKSAVYMNVTLSVEDLKFLPGTQKKLNAPPGFDKQKVWTANNFRFSLDGFGEQCKRVSKIESFTIKQNITEYHSGNFRAPIKCSTQVEFPNLTFFVPEADGEVPGRLNGELVVFDNEKKTLFTMKIQGADILSITPDKQDAGSEDIKQVKIEIYTELMTFQYA
jgi:phage tail-like protein